MPRSKPQEQACDTKDDVRGAITGLCLAGKQLRIPVVEYHPLTFRLIKLMPTNTQIPIKTAGRERNVRARGDAADRNIPTINTISTFIAQP